MSGSSYLDELLIFLAATVLIGPLFRRLGISAVIGYLFTGLIIGPFGLGFIVNVEGSKALGHFGVLFLLFNIALELPWQRLKVLRRYVFGLGLAQVVFTSVLIAGVCIFFKIPASTAVVIGAGLSLSSTAMVMKVLSERGELAARFGRVSFSVLLFQDMAVVAFLVLIPLLSTKSVAYDTLAQTIGIATLKAATALILIAFFGRWVLRPIYRIVASTGSTEIFMATTLLLIFSTSVITYAVGLSMELGAFMAGLLLAETEYRHQVQADLEPFRGLLLGLFFITVGMSVDTQLLIKHIDTIAMIVGALIIAKTVLITLLSRLWSLSLGAALRIGLLLSAGGEFGFVLFGPAVNMGILSEQTGHILYLSIFVTMTLTPLLAGIGKKLANLLDKEPNIALQAATEEAGDFKDHVLIIGFGSVGQTVGKLLTEQLVPFVSLDIDMQQVEHARSLGIPTYYGDARRVETLRAIGAARARAAVVALEKKTSSTMVVSLLKRTFPGVELFVRVRDEDHAEKIRKMGATPVIPETLEPSLHLATAVLNVMGIANDQIVKTVEGYRRHHLPFSATSISLNMPSTEEEGMDKKSVNTA